MPFYHEHESPSWPVHGGLEPVVRPKPEGEQYRGHGMPDTPHPGDHSKYHGSTGDVPKSGKPDIYPLGPHDLDKKVHIEGAHSVAAERPGTSTAPHTKLPGPYAEIPPAEHHTYAPLPKPKQDIPRPASPSLSNHKRRPERQRCANGKPRKNGSSHHHEHDRGHHEHVPLLLGGEQKSAVEANV